MTTEIQNKVNKNCFCGGWTLIKTGMDTEQNMKQNSEFSQEL